jgi:O-methyltransferase
MEFHQEEQTMLAHNQRLQKLFGGGVIERSYLAAISRAQLFLLKRHKDPEVVRLIRQTRRQRRSLLTAYEAHTVYSLAKAYAHVPGEMAEVGVFQGASAKLFCEAKGDKPLHLCDTFEGLPKAHEHDGPVHAEQQYACTLDSVRAYLDGYPNIHFYKGRFPETAAPLADKTFCFAHFDVDLYESTRACLEFFYPRMTVGGVMLSHDYSILAGVRRAVDEFLANKPERPIELPSTQCMIVKLARC